MSLLKSIPTIWLQPTRLEAGDDRISSKIQEIIDMPGLNRTMYTHLVSKSRLLENKLLKWNNFLEQEYELEEFLVHFKTSIKLQMPQSIVTSNIGCC